MKCIALNTILLITHDRLIRADLRPGRAAGMADLHEERRPAADDLPSLVEAALRLGRTRPGNVWILSSELWTQVLSLPSEALSGLKAEDLSRALGFEAEPFSGINALEAAAAQVPLPGEGSQRAFWLTEISAVQLQQIDEIVKQSGGRLLGMSHPGGLPRPLCLPPEGQETWQRVELWPGAVICIEGGAGRHATWRSAIATPTGPLGGRRRAMADVSPGGRRDRVAPRRQRRGPRRVARPKPSEPRRRRRQPAIPDGLGRGAWPREVWRRRW